MINYILADNQELTRASLEHLLKRINSAEIPGIVRADNKEQLLAALQAHSQSVIVLDYTLFDFNDVEDLLIVNSRFPNSSWVIISDDLTDQFSRRVVYSASNISIVFKDASLMEIKDTIIYASRGERYICQRVTESLLLQQKRDESAQQSTLTPTEVEIICAIAQGKTTKEIAAERSSSIHTINTHRKNIFRKFGVNTAHEAVRYAVRAGLVNIAEYYI